MGTLTPSEFKDVAAGLPKPSPIVTTSPEKANSRDIVTMILDKTTSSASHDLSNFSLPSSTTSSPYRYSSPVRSTQLVDDSASTPKIQKVLSDIAAQRDSSIERVKALQKQNLDLKAKLHEASRWKEMCEALERERESLTLSLSSSERIRKQQKDLIKLLQENGGRTVDNSMVQSVLDPNNSMLLSVNNDSFSFVDITNTSPLSKSFSRTEGGGEDGRRSPPTSKSPVTRKKSLTPTSAGVRRRSVSTTSSGKKLSAVMEVMGGGDSKPPTGARRRSSTADAALASQISGNRQRRPSTSSASSRTRRPSSSSIASSVTMNEASPKMGK
ncbi:hypothetical protein TrRE_jg10409, partial [Triparma retinervis]